MTDPIVNRVGVLKVVHEHVTTLYNAAREDASKVLTKGSRIPVCTPDGEKIATVSKTDPVKTARINDEPAFEAWVRANHPDRIKTVQAISGTETEVKKVLFAHAPHLLRPYTVVDPELVKEIKQRSMKAGQPVGPEGETDVLGVVVERPDGTVTCRPDDDGLGEVIQMFRSGQLTFEGLAQIEGPDGAA